MSFFDSVLAFLEGIKSVIGTSGAIQGTISDAISSGIERAFRRIKKPLEHSILKISFMIMSLFFIVWGTALFLDNFMPYNGIGFVIVGAFFGIILFLFLQGKETG